MILPLLATLLAACGKPPPPDRGAASTSPRLLVVSTVHPVTLLSRAVAGDCAPVTPLLPPGAGPHGFQARPSDPALLARARVLVSNGLGLESFLDGLVAAADNPGLTVIDSSRGVATLSATAGEGPMRPVSDRDRHDPHGAAHDHHQHAGINPHIWLDPRRAMQQVETIRDGLISADPACAATYRRNASRAIGRLRQLDAEIAAALQPYRGRSFVTLHASAPYFAQRYGLREAVLVASPDQEPSPRDLQRLSALVKRERLRALLSEPGQENRAFSGLARDLGLPVLSFDPLERGEDRDGRAGLETYLSAMRRNAAALRQAFGGPPLSAGAAPASGGPAASPAAAPVAAPGTRPSALPPRSNRP